MRPTFRSATILASAVGVRALAFECYAAGVRFWQAVREQIAG
jgi:hypothetical protein